MAAQSLVPLSTHIYHPSPAYHRDFFLLRMPIKVNNQPSIIKMIDGTPVLYCPEVELSVQLVVLAQHVSTVLADYHIALKGAYYDDNYPLYAIDLPPPISYEGIQSLLPAFSNVCSSIAERYFSRVSCKTAVTVHMQLLLCSPAKDSSSTSKVTAIQLGEDLSDKSDEIFLTFLGSKIFKFSELFADSSNSSPTIIGLSSKAAAVSFASLLRALSEKASHKWFNIGAFLGVSAEKLQTIEKQYQNPESCLTHMLKNVVDCKTELTWGKVVSTLSTVGLSNLAEEVSEEHGVCFLRAENEDTASLTKPTLQSLSQSLAVVSAKWFNFGALLGVPPSTLQAIDNQYHSDCDDCLTRMLIWVIENSRITWSSVAQALGQIGYGDLAEQIRQSHDISPVQSEGVTQQAEAGDTEQWKIEVESSVTEVRQDIDTLIQQDYANIKHELKRLKEEKDGIQKRLEQEETQCNSLHESKRLLAIQLKQKDKQHRQKIKAIEKKIIEKQSTVADLKSELDHTNMKYNEKSQQMASLAATLSLKTSELVEKSFVLSKIKESFLECDDAFRIADGRRLDYQKRLVEAKQVSQAAYLAEIKSQIETETECVKSLEEECHIVDKQCSDLATIIASIEGDIATKEQVCKTLESNTEVFVEKQIELTELKMDVINRKLELAKAEIKRQDSTQELAYHQKDFQKAKNRLPELSKCSVDGIDVPVHKARAYVAIEIKVHIYDRDGEPCSGQHLVSLCCETDEQMFTEPNNSTPGTYSLSYTPSCLGEHSLVVAVNSTPINETPFNMFFLNSPHPPNCTITVLDKKAVQRKKFGALVQLKDQNGDPVNSQQNVSAYLKFPDTASEKIKANISSSSDSPDTYMLSLTSPSSGEGVLSVFVDDQLIASPCVMLRAFKDRAFKMLLIGKIGSGKTSFLNLLYNCATVGSGFEAKGLEQFTQFNDIKLEKAQAHPKETKTSDATLYNVEVGDLKIGVIDTPGFGDSRGLEQDKTNAQRIISALKKEEYINCVCLIINGRQLGADALLKYVLTDIAAILPKGILDNVIVVFSNTGDFLDVDFDTGLLKQYFGIEIENILCVENPYCRFEKAKAKVGQLGIDRLTKSLQKAFEDTSEVLTEMCETITNFPQVQTHRFIELYEKKQDIEKSVLDSLTAYDNQMMLEKSLIDTEAEVKAAVRKKSDNKDYKTFIPTKWGEHKHSILCAYSNCQSNCHTPCDDFSKLLDKEMIKCCVVFDGSNTCRKCGHSYIDHYDGKLEENTPSIRVKESKKKKFDKASTEEIQAQSRFNEQNEKKRTAAAERKKLSEKLLKQISEFEDESVAGNYTKILESQLAVIDTRIEASTGPESEDLCKTRDEVKKKLEVIQQAKKNTVYQCTARAFNLVN
ncbi:uncharacterized protein LOC135347466 isoform X2 [Halichondria panicea]|uniref:uncharacterized protein LOC135347466 isoform X2 n=1 Tax=Halichondria panicea TaxID=6063 RepID=UPI00312BC075